MRKRIFPEIWRRSHRGRHQSGFVRPRIRERVAVDGRIRKQLMQPAVSGWFVKISLFPRSRIYRRHDGTRPRSLFIDSPFQIAIAALFIDRIRPPNIDRIVISVSLSMRRFRKSRSARFKGVVIDLCLKIENLGKSGRQKRKTDLESS